MLSALLHRRHGLALQLGLIDIVVAVTLHPIEMGLNSPLVIFFDAQLHVLLLSAISRPIIDGTAYIHLLQYNLAILMDAWLSDDNAAWVRVCRLIVFLKPLQRRAAPSMIEEVELGAATTSVERR